MATKHVKFTDEEVSQAAVTVPGDTDLPHSAVYLTLTMMSVGSCILGRGLSSIATSSFPLKTTAFIVSFEAMVS